MGAIAVGNEILVIDADREIAIEGESGTVTPEELSILIDDNSFYFTHNGDKLRLSKVSASINTYVHIGDRFVRSIVILNKTTGEWVYQEMVGSTIQTTLPTADGPNDGLLREVLVPLSEKGTITEYLYYNYLYYEEV